MFHSAGNKRDVDWVSPRLLIWIAQILIFLSCGVLAFLLRFEFSLHSETLAHMYRAVPAWLLIKSLTFWALHLDRGTWRFASVPDMQRIGAANLIGSIVAAAVILSFTTPGFPRSVLVLDLVLCLQFTAGARLLARVVCNYALRARNNNPVKDVLIYGAGVAGVMLLQEIRQNPRLSYCVRGFIDDDSRKRGMRVQTIPVLGSGSDLPAIAEKEPITEVLIAIPSATGSQMTRILRHCHRAGLRCKTIPGLGELLSGAGLARQIRDVAMKDLLGRMPVALDETSIRAKIEGSVVLVTGAAGSIGSELCRQITRFQPKAIVAYEIAETPLFELQQEMLGRHPNLAFHAEIGSILDPYRLKEIFDRHRPRIVFHAAAYKHVPMMEEALFAAVENNILGTRNVAVAAIESASSDFVMISSDKAVRPTSIMGATKRAAELLINSMQSDTKFVSVRFGNVLGSSGSVIPIFKRQIAAGGPVTVTHPEMRRFFMTVPEACQLVLQASTMSTGGEVFVLDMGEPLLIADLARDLIVLSGLRPGEDIEIKYTGIRPGEKLYEEISATAENTLPTYHEKIKIFSGPVKSASEMDQYIERVQHMCALRDAEGLVNELMRLEPEYTPSEHVLRRLPSAALMSNSRSKQELRPAVGLQGQI